MQSSYEELYLLINYLALIGIWFAIPSVNLLINRDKRWPIALSILSCLVILLLISYFTKWKILFPKFQEKYTLADYDKIKQCKCINYKESDFSL